MSENATQRLAKLAAAQGWSNRPAYFADGRVWTFAEVYEGASRVAGGYRSRGLRPGDRVLIALPDSVEQVWCLLGAWQAGLVAVPVNVLMSREDLARDAGTAEPALAVIDPHTAGWLQTAGLFPTCEVSALATAQADTWFAPGGEAPALALFTSGTTGIPKLCFFRHEDIRGPGRAEDPGTVGFTASRMYFLAGLTFSVFITLDTGRPAVLSRQRATPATAVELMREHAVTAFLAQPSFLARLLLEPGHVEVFNRLRHVTCTGEVLSARLRERLVPILGDRLINPYGATECGPVAVGRPATYTVPSAVGPVFAGRSVRIVDDNGEVLPAGAQGELHVRVPQATCGVARGGLGPRRMTDTWWRTGDLACVDGDGIVHVFGRLDDVEIVAGQNVVPTEVERLLESHPSVLEAAVSSVRRPAGDTSLRAFVVAAPPDGPEGAACGRASSAELIELVRSSLSWYKVPHDVVWLDALPRNANGKILRRHLRASGDQHG